MLHAPPNDEEEHLRKIVLDLQGMLAQAESGQETAQ